MRKIEKRAIMCLLIASVLVIGLVFFAWRYVTQGDGWAMYGTNKHVYEDGAFKKGKVYDINDILLLDNESGNMEFNENYAIRKANVHLSGDNKGNIATGANKVFGYKLTGYNLLTGTYSITGQGRTLHLTVDADICATANEALDGRNGTVGVYNYNTGEIICLVSSPNYDPTDPPVLDSDDTSGTYMNRFFSSKFPPGSIFKLVTAAASIENREDYATWEYTCDGREDYPDGGFVSCQSAHGTVNLEQALGVSCNVYFGKLAEALGADTMEEYVKKTDLNQSQKVNGISTAAGSFEFPKSGVNLAWAGIGQYKDQLNPCSMMTYMGAIARGGRAVSPKILHNVTFSSGIPASLPWKWWTGRMIEKETAEILKAMMRNNVTEHYGNDSFPGLNICAKSGTAEVTTDKQNRPNAWFAGFLDDTEHPYAFIVLVENGGFGSDVAGSVANRVLQRIVEKY